MAISLQRANDIQAATQALEAKCQDALDSGEISPQAMASALAAQKVLEAFHRLAERTYTDDGGDVSALSGGSKTDP